LQRSDGANRRGQERVPLELRRASVGFMPPQ